MKYTYGHIVNMRSRELDNLLQELYNHLNINEDTKIPYGLSYILWVNLLYELTEATTKKDVIKIFLKYLSKV